MKPKERLAMKYLFTIVTLVFRFKFVMPKCLKKIGTIHPGKKKWSIAI